MKGYCGFSWKPQSRNAAGPQEESAEDKPEPESPSVPSFCCPLGIWHIHLPLQTSFLFFSFYFLCSTVSKMSRWWPPHIFFHPYLLPLLIHVESRCTTLTHPIISRNAGSYGINRDAGGYTCAKSF